MKKVFLVFLVTLGLFIPMKGAEATHWYLWSDTNYAFWLDDKSIITNYDKNWCKFNIIIEDMKTGELKPCSSPIIIYKRNGEWWLSFRDYNDTIPKPVEYYSGWWQPWGLKWLFDNGYIEE